MTVKPYRLTRDERRVMAYFAKRGSEHTVWEIVRGVERNLFFVNLATFSIEYHDADDILRAIFGLLQKEILCVKGAKYVVTAKGKIKCVGTYLDIRTQNQRGYLKRQKCIQSVIATLPAAAALLYIISEVSSWWSP